MPNNQRQELVKDATRIYKYYSNLAELAKRRMIWYQDRAIEAKTVLTNLQKENYCDNHSNYKK